MTTVRMPCVLATENILGSSRLLQPITYRFAEREPIRTSRFAGGNGRHFCQRDCDVSGLERRFLS